MDKVELAKMLGLDTEYTVVANKYDIADLLEHSWNTIDFPFLAGKLVVTIEQEDLSKDNLGISLEDLEKEEEDIKVCCKQVEDLLWERAADQYLERIKKAAMVVGGE